MTPRKNNSTSKVLRCRAAKMSRTLNWETSKEGALPSLGRFAFVEEGNRKRHVHGYSTVVHVCCRFRVSNVMWCCSDARTATWFRKVQGTQYTLNIWSMTMKTKLVKNSSNFKPQMVLSSKRRPSSTLSADPSRPIGGIRATC